MGTNEGVFIVCREVDRDTGAVAVYRIERKPDAATRVILGWRARLNPELRYFICAERWAENFEQLRQILGKNLVISGAVLNQFEITEIH